MPCPLFEPRQRISQAREATIRLPLIYEFEGVCHAGNHAPTPEHRFRYCNHGYAKGNCANYPEAGLISAVRFDVTKRTSSLLTVLVLEEANHWPRSWSTFEFLIQDQRIQPEIADTCRRAQLFEFCQAYLFNAQRTDAQETSPENVSSKNA